MMRKMQRRRWSFWLASMLFLLALFLFGQLIYQSYFPKKEIAKNDPSPAPTADSKFQFDFYKILPKM